LWYLPFGNGAERPEFRECAKHPRIEENGYVLYYTSQCPFNAKYVPVQEQQLRKTGMFDQLVQNGRIDPSGVKKLCGFFLKIPAEGTIRKTDLFGKFGLGDPPVFDKVLDTLPGIAGKVSAVHRNLLHHNSSICTKSLNWI
jgi:hypothetical protein